LQEEIENLKLGNKIKQDKGQEKQQLKDARHFTKVYHTPIKRMVNGRLLSTREYSTLLKLMMYIEPKSNIIIREDKQYADINDIARLIGLNRNNTSDILNSLCEKEVLTKLEYGNKNNKQFFIVNPDYCSCVKIGEENEIRINYEKHQKLLLND
jgi:hypothetical protein